jgi:hypothetical protein
VTLTPDYEGTVEATNYISEAETYQATETVITLSINI